MVICYISPSKKVTKHDAAEVVEFADLKPHNQEMERFFPVVFFWWYLISITSWVTPCPSIKIPTPQKKRRHRIWRTLIASNHWSPKNQWTYLTYSSISFAHSHDFSTTWMKSGRQRFLVFTTLFGGNSGLVTVLIWRFDDGERLFASWVLLRDTLAVHVVNLVDYDLNNSLYQKRPPCFLATI